MSQNNKEATQKSSLCKKCQFYNITTDSCPIKDIELCSEQDIETCDEFLVKEKLVMF